MRAISTFILILLTPTLSFCQVINDSLDWHRYFPLEVGNEWQYIDAESGPASRFIIRKDTLVEGRHYFIGRETFFAPDGSSQTFHPSRDIFLRYDTSGVVVEFDNPDADTGYIPIVFKRGLESFPVVDLRSDFGSTVDHPDGLSDPINVTGEYETSLGLGQPEITVAAIKDFSSFVWFWSFAADVGFLGGGNLWGPRIRYARVSGVEYGTVLVSVEKVSNREQSSAEVSVYPNPATSDLNISIRADSCDRCSIIISDTIGRHVSTYPVHSVGVVTIVHIDVSSLVPGLYFVRVKGMLGRLSNVHPVLVVR